MVVGVGIESLVIAVGVEVGFVVVIVGAGVESLVMVVGVDGGPRVIVVGGGVESLVMVVGVRAGPLVIVVVAGSWVEEGEITLGPDVEVRGEVGVTVILESATAVLSSKLPGDEVLGFNSEINFSSI